MKLVTVPSSPFGRKVAVVASELGLLNRIEVVHDPAKASTDDLVAAVAKAGYTAKPAAF